MKKTLSPLVLVLWLFCCGMCRVAGATPYQVSGWIQDPGFNGGLKMELSGSASVHISYALELTDGGGVNETSAVREYLNVHGNSGWNFLWQFIEIKSWDFQIHDGAYTFYSDGNSEGKFVGEVDDLNLPFGYNLGRVGDGNGDWVNWQGDTTIISVFNGADEKMGAHQSLLNDPEYFVIELFDLYHNPAEDELETHYLRFSTNNSLHPVPEPATLFLFGLGVAGVVCRHGLKI